MASNYGLFLGWDRPIEGHQAHAVELFNSLLNYLGKQQQAGNIESFEPVFLTPHGGDMNGFVLVRGEQKKLDAFRWNDDFLELSTKATAWVSGWGVLPTVHGDELKKQMGRYTQVIKK